MKKEPLIAVFFGVGFGVILAIFFVMQSKESQLNNSKTINNSLKTVTPKIKPISTSMLEISEPTDNLILDSNTVNIKGKTNKNSLIVINSPIKELAYKTEKEDFSISFPLTLGENVIQLTVYPDDKSLSSINKTIQVYYLTNTD